jgi:hypothetical protein
MAGAFVLGLIKQVPVLLFPMNGQILMEPGLDLAFSRGSKAVDFLLEKGCACSAEQ